MQFEFKLSAAECMLEALTTRTEKHGQDDIPAVTLKLSTNQASSVLACFSPTLEAHLFSKENIQKDLLGDGAALRYPHVEYPLKLDHVMSGAKIAIDYGVGEPIRDENATVDDFQVTPMAGGTVVLVFKVGFRAPQEAEGRLYVSQKRKLTVSITPPELAQMPAAA